MSLSLWTRLNNWRRLRRTAEPPSFTLSAAESASTVDKGTTRVVRLNVVYAGSRFGGTLTPSTNSLPSGVTASFSPATLTAADGFVDMSLIVDAGAGTITDDAYTVTLSGTGINGKTINQTVTVPDPLPPESISIAPDDDTVSVTQGSTVDITYTLTRVGAYTADVPLSITGLPSGVTASYPNGATYSGNDQTKIVRLTADIAASTVTDDAFTATAAGDGGSVADATDSGTVTVVAYVAPPAATPVTGDDFSSYANTAALSANVGTQASGKLYNDTATKGLSNGAVTLDASVTLDGHATCRFRIWDAGSTAPRLASNTFTTIANSWTRRVVRWSPGFSLNLNNGYTGGKAHKQTNYALAGVQGRVLGSMVNGSGSPGAVGNGGQMAYESHHRTGGSQDVTAVYLYAVLRSLVTGPDSVFDDGLWYEEITHVERVASGHTRSRIWFHEYGATPALLCTLDNKEGDYAAPAGVNQCTFFDTFNALQIGPPATGTDQSAWLGLWDVYDEATDPDPFGLGYTGGANVSLDMSIDDDTIALTAGGAGVTQTVTLTRGSDLTSQSVVMEKGDAWPTGLSVSFAQSTVPSGTTTVAATFTASASCAPGTYTRRIAGVTTGKTGVGAASDFIPITFTIT